jgi:hypothetical protein
MEVSKRDYFAAQALLGILSRSGGQSRDPDAYSKTAAEAFLYADAMLKLSKTLLDPVEIDPEVLAKKGLLTNGEDQPKAN